MSMWRILRVGIIVAIISLPVSVSAVGLVPVLQNTCDGPSCSFCDFAQLAQNILNDAIYMAVVLSAALFAWAGWKYMTGGSNPGEIKKAKAIFINVFIGLIIILTAWLLVDTLMRAVTGDNSTFGPWNKVCNK